MLRDEYNRLLSLFAQSTDGKPVDLEVVFKESLTFFEHLNAEMKEGSPDDKREALKMMSELYTQMVAQTKKICEKTGLSEDQLAAFAENPNNFSPEQWQSIQHAKTKMLHAGKDLAKAVSAAAPPQKKPEEKPQAPEAKAPKESRPKKPKKSDWMRS